jgi:DNA modification methylase
MADNKLFYGDNLDVLRRYVRDESVDLIYLDPPFNSRQDYNVLFAEKDGTRSSSQITAFEDTWEWNLDAERAYQEVVERGGWVSNAMQAFRTFLGKQRHDGVSGDDGSAAHRVEARAQGNRIDLSALRSHGEPLFKDVDGCGVRPPELCK